MNQRSPGHPPAPGGGRPAERDLLLRVEVAGDLDRRVVALYGDLDVLTIARLRDALHECTAMGTRLVVVDLAAVGFLAVCGLTALLDAHRTCEDAGARLRLRHVSPFIRRVLRLADLDTVLVDEATPAAETGPGQERVPPPRRLLPGGAVSSRDPQPAADREVRLARAFVELSSACPGRRTSHELTPDAGHDPAPDRTDRGSLGRLTGCCVELLDIDAAAAFLLDDRNVLQLVASTHPPTGRASPGAADLIGQVGLEARRPCWAVPGDGRSPPYHPAQALPLRQDGRIVGTLDLFRRHPGCLSPGDAALAQALADVATATIFSERSARDSEVVNRQLQTALENRVVIEQAKGMLSQRHGLTLETAFQRMRGYARRRNLRVRDVARDVVNGNDSPRIESGRLP